MLGTHTELPVRASLVARALPWGGEVQDPSFDAGKEQCSQARLMEIACGNPQRKAPG